MADNLLSSSEQYVKKSNRFLLIGSILALVAFLFGMFYLFADKGTVSEPAPVEFPRQTTMGLDRQAADIMDFDRKESTVELMIEPNAVNWPAVTIGGSAEASVTLTAKNGAVKFNAIELADSSQQDGFIVQGECTAGLILDKNNSCNVKILWNPVSVRSLQNTLNVFWVEEDPDAPIEPPEQKSMLSIFGQSTDSKDCIICEDKTAEDRERSLLGELNPETGLYVKDGKIMGIVQPERVALALDGTILGEIKKDTNEVVNAEGDVLGRILPDDTIVTKDLTVLGAAVALLPVLDGKGNVIGELVVDGEIAQVVDASNSLVGFPMADGSVVMEGRVIGSIMPWAVVLNLSGKPIGATKKDGSVVDINNQKIGRILPGGMFVSPAGAILGGVAQEGLAIGANAALMGKVRQNGEIYNVFEQQVGYTTADGLVLDMSNVPLGQVVREGLIVDEKGQVVAFVNSEAKAVNALGDLLGSVDANGFVKVDEDTVGAVMGHGRVIGYDLKVQGLVLPNGAVAKANGEVLGRVLDTSYAVDLNGDVIGAVIPKGTAIAQGCVLLGIIDLDAQVLNPKMELVGTLNPDKKVIAADGKVIGGITPRGSVVGLDGKIIGFIRPDGKVVNKLGKVIGCVNPDGTVVNEDGELIGYAVDAATGERLGGGASSGQVVNNRGEIIGYLPPDGIIVSLEGKYLGRFAKSSGVAVDEKGEKFARVLPDFTAISLNNNAVIGALIPDGSQILSIEGEHIGYLRGDGKVVDFDGKGLGIVRADGSVLDDKKVVIGAIMPRGSVIDWNGNVIGSVQEDGRVISGGQKQIGSVALNRTVIGTDGTVIGMVFPEPSVPVGVDGKILGTLTIAGKINRDGSEIGHITAAGNIFGNSGEFIGSLVRLGVVMGGDKQIKGWFEFDGKTVASNGSVLGQMMSDGYVVSEDGTQIAHLIPRLTVTDLNGGFAGLVSPAGTLLGVNDDVLGSFPFDNRLLDTNDKWVGVNLMAGAVVSSDANYIGHVRYDAAVIDTKGLILGRVHADNRVFNAKNEVIGQYVPYGSYVFDEKGRVLGVTSFDGQVRNSKDAVIGTVIGSTVVDKANEVIGNFMQTGFALNPQGRVMGHIGPNGRIPVKTDLDTIFNVLTSDNRVINQNRQIIGGNVPFGVGLALDLTDAGNVVPDGVVQLGLTASGRTLTDRTVYDTLDKVSGGIVPYQAMIGRDGRTVGMMTALNAVNDFAGQKAATLMPFGSAISQDNKLFAMTAKGGKAVDDWAKTVGFVGADGVVVTADGAIAGRAMQDGTIVRLLSRDAYGVMPDFADVVASGIAIGLKPVLYGRAFPSGNVLNTTNEVISKVLDDATLLGNDGNLSGALVPWRTAVDAQSNVLGNTTGDGYVTSVSGKSVGPLASNGAVKKSSDVKHQLHTLGGVIADTLVTDHCQIVGQVRYDGKVVDVNGQVSATLDLEGKATSMDGKRVGGIVLKGTVIADDGKGTPLGRTMPDSDVVNYDGVSIGCALDDGTVIDADGNVIGKVLKRGIVVDENGNVIGRVLRDGRVVNANGDVIGRVLADGSVVDENGNVIGHVVDLKKNHLLFDDKGGIIGSMDRGGRVFDNNGKHLFTVAPDGKIYDPNGNHIGYLGENGEIMDLDGNIIGSATDFPHYLYDENGNIIGYIKDDKVFDLNGKQIGYVGPDGIIYNMDGNSAGQINSDGSVSLGTETEDCLNTKYDGTVYDDKGEVLYTIKCGKIYDKYGNLIGYIDENGNMYDLNGNYMGHIDENGNVYDKDGNLIGRFRPSNGKGYVAGVKGLFGDSLKTTDLSGRKIAIGGQNFMVMPDGSILNKDGSVVGRLRNGVPYSLSDKPLAEEIAAARMFEQPAGVQISPEQAAQMQSLLARRRQGMKSSLGGGLPKLTPNGRILARGKEKKNKTFFGDKNASAWPVDMHRMILKDKAIPAVLARSIDSRYPSVPATAIVERHIYTEDGRNIIIPAGSKLIGQAAGGGGTNNVSKLEISWERLIRPDGGAFKLSAQSGDAQGRGGVAAYLDQQFLAKYGKPLLTSVLTSAFSYVTAVDDSVTTNQDNATTTQSDRAQAAQDARENLIDTMDMLFQQLIEESSPTPPVVFIPAGTRLTVFAMEDLYLREEADDEEDYVAEFGEDPSAAQTPDSNFGLGQRQALGGTNATTGAVQGFNTSPAVDSIPEFNGEDGPFYDPIYQENIEDNMEPQPIYDGSASRETGRHIGTSHTNKLGERGVPTVAGSGKPLTLEEVYRTQKGITSYPDDIRKGQMTAPLQNQVVGSTGSSNLF